MNKRDYILKKLKERGLDIETEAQASGPKLNIDFTPFIQNDIIKKYEEVLSMPPPADGKDGKDGAPGERGERGSRFIGHFDSSKELPDTKDAQIGDFAIIDGTIWYVV